MNPEEALAVWRAEESKVRERLARTTGYARAEQLDGRSGLETLQAIFAGELPPPPMGDTLGFVPIRIERGRAIFQASPISATTTRWETVRWMSCRMSTSGSTSPLRGG